MKPKTVSRRNTNLIEWVFSNADNGICHYKGVDEPIDASQIKFEYNNFKRCKLIDKGDMEYEVRVYDYFYFTFKLKSN